MEEYLYNLKVTYNYDDDLINTIRKIIPALIMHFGIENENLILNALFSCEIHIQENGENSVQFINKYFPNKEVGNIPKIAVAFYDSEPVNKLESKRIIYLKKVLAILVTMIIYLH